MDLRKMRENIDRIDAEIVWLLSRRMESAIRTRRFKTHISDSGREEDILARARERARGIFSSRFGDVLFQAILEESRRLQSLDVPLAAFQGEHGSYGEVAMLEYNKDIIGIPCREFSEVFEGVTKGAVDYGIVPIENSLEGSENEVIELLMHSDLKIAGAINVPIRHCLMTLRDTDYRDIKDVYSNPGILSQCRGFIERHRFDPRPYYDSAGAALMLLRDRPRAAAVIGSSLCASLYDLEILKEGVEDSETNMTRYVVLAKEHNGDGGDTCSLIFTLAHKAGALYEALKVFYEAGINLTKIESQTVRGKNAQVAFLMDFSGNSSDPKVIAALSEVKKHVVSLKELGCFKEIGRA